MPKVGIDFGTTNSLVVAYDKKHNAFTYFNFEGEKPVPMSSTVWYHDDKVEVGVKARISMQQYADVEGHHFEKSIKSKLGTVQTVNIFGESIKPYKVASKILKQLKKQAVDIWHAEQAGVDLKSAVFTVPINFSGESRRNLRKSANEAGIEVTTFIHEPFAAIIGYFFTKNDAPYKQIMDSLRSLNGQYLLTFDWGGGTLDITVTLVRNGKMVELGTSELTDFAGDKFDEYIAKLAWNRFLDKYGFKYSNEYLEIIRKKKWGRLLAIAEQCKIKLSSDDKTEFLIENIINDEGIDEVITRNDFEQLLVEILDTACNRIDSALSEANIQNIDISHVLLTGGTCYIPAVQKRLREKFGHRVETVKDADLLIAQGAAVISELGWLPFLTKDIEVELCDESYYPIFQEGMPIAANDTAKNSEVFSCVDHRGKNAKVIICEGNNQKKDKNLAILNVPILGIGDDIYVEAALDRDIVMTVKAHSKMVHGYGENEKYSIQRSAEIYQMCFGLDFER